MEAILAELRELRAIVNALVARDREPVGVKVKGVRAACSARTAKDAPCRNRAADGCGDMCRMHMNAFVRAGVRATESAAAREEGEVRGPRTRSRVKAARAAKCLPEHAHGCGLGLGTGGAGGLCGLCGTHGDALDPRAPSGVFRGTRASEASVRAAIQGLGI
jgi:hypothetical protein